MDVENALFGSDGQRFLCVSKGKNDVILASEEYGITRFTGSQSHFGIFEKEDRLFIQDMGSADGTFVNGASLPEYIPNKGSLPMELPFWSQIRVGLAKIEIEIISEKMHEENEKEDPSELKRLLNRGVYLTSRKRYSEALTAIDKILSLDNTNPTAWYLKSLAHAGMGDREMTKRALDKAKRLQNERRSEARTLNKISSRTDEEDVLVTMDDNIVSCKESPPLLKVMASDEEDSLDTEDGELDYVKDVKKADPRSSFREKEAYKRHSLIKKYNRRISHIEDEIALLKKISIDIGSLNYLINLAKERISSHDLDKVNSILEKAENIIEEILSTHLKDAAAEQLIKANEMFEIMEEQGKDVTDEKKILQEVVIAYQDEDYFKAIQLTLEVNERLSTLDKDLDDKTETMTLLREVREMINKSHMDDSDLLPISELIQDAGENLQLGNYNKARRIALTVKRKLDEFGEDAETIMEEKEAARTYAKRKGPVDFRTIYDERFSRSAESLEVLSPAAEDTLGTSPDPTASKKEEYSTKSSHARYSDILENLLVKIDFMKDLGLPMEPYEELLHHSKKALINGDVDGVRNTVSKVEDIIRKINDGEISVIAKRVYPKTREFLGRVAEAGGEVGEAESLLDEAIKAFRARDFIDTCRLCQETNSILTGIERKLKAKESTKSILVEMEEMVKKATALNVDLSPMEDDIHKVGLKLERGDYEEAKVISESLQRRFDKELAAAQMRRLEILGKEVKYLINKAKMYELEVDEQTKELVLVEQYIDKGEFGEATTLIEGMKTELEEHIHRQVHVEREKSINNAEEQLGIREEETGETNEKLHLSLIEAREALAKGNYEQVDASLELFTYNYTELDKKEKLSVYSEDIDQIIDKMDFLRDLDIDLGSFEEVLDQTADSLSRGDVAAVKEGFSKIKNIINGLNSGEIKRITKKLFPKTKRLLKQVEQAGGNINAEQEILGYALMAFRKKNYIDTYRLCLEAKERLELFQEELVAKEKASSMLNNARTMMRKLSEEPSDIGPFKELIDDARNDMRRQKYKKAMDKAEKAIVGLGEIMESVYTDKEAEVGEELAHEIGKARELGLESEDIFDKLSEIKVYKDEGKHEKVLNLMGDLKRTIGKRTDKQMLRTRELKVAECIEELNALKDYSAKEYPDLQSPLVAAKAALKERDFDRVDGYLEEFQMYMGEYSREFYKKDHLKKLEGLRSEIETMEELGADVSEIRSLMEQSQELLDGGNDTEAERTLAKIKTIIEDRNIVEFKKIAKNLLPKTKGMLYAVRKEKYDVENVEKMMNSAQSSYREKKYLDACRFCRQAMDDLAVLKKEMKAKEKTISLIRDTQKRMKKAPLEAKEAARLGDMILEVKTIMKGGDYAEALVHSKKLRVLAKIIIESSYEMTFGSMENELNILLEKMNDSNLNVEGIEDEINRAIALREKGKEGEAISLMESQKELLEKSLYEHHFLSRKRIIEELELEFKTLSEETGESPEEFETSLELAKEALNNEEYDEVDVYLEEFQMYKDEYKRQFYFSDFKDRISKLDHMVDLLMNIDIELGVIPELLEISKESLEKEDFNETEKTLRKAEGKLNDINMGSLKDMAKQNIRDIKGLLIPLRKKNVNIKRSEKYLKMTIKAYRENDIIRSLELSLETKKQMEIQVEGMKNKGQTIRIIKEIRKKIKEAGLSETDLSSIEEMIISAKGNLKKKAHADALDIAKSAKKRLSETIESVYISKLEKLTDDVETKIKRAVEFSVDVEKPTEELAEVNKLKDLGKYEEAVNLAESLVSSVSKLLYSEVNQSREERIAEAENEFKILQESSGEEYDDLKWCIEKAKEALENNDYDQTDIYLDEFRMYKDEYQWIFDLSHYSNRIDRIREDADAIHGLNLDTSSIEELLELSKKALREEDFRMVVEAMDVAENLCREIIDGPIKKSAKELIADTREQIVQLKKEGIKAKSIERALIRARSRFKGKDYIGAIRAAQIAKEKTVNLKEGIESREAVITVLKDARTQMNEADLPEMDTLPVEQMIQEAKSGLKKKDFITSLEHANSAREKLTDIINSAYIEKLDELSGKLNMEIERAIEKELDIDKFMIKLDEVKALRESGEFAEAINLSSSVHKELSGMIYEQVHVSRERRIENAVREQTALSSETGEEYDDLLSSIEGAKEGLAEKDYDRVDRSLEEFQMYKDEYQRIFIISHYRDKIDRIKEDADAIRKMDVDISPIEELMEISENALSEEDLEVLGEAVDKAGDLCREIIEGPIKESAKELMSDTRELILPMKKAGIKARSIERALKRARSTFREKDYTGAWQAAHTAKEKTLELKEGLESRGAAIALLKETRTQMNEVDLPELDTLPVEHMIQEAKSGLKKKDFIASLELANSAREKLTDIINSAYIEKLDELSGKLNINVKRAIEQDLDIDNFMIKLGEVKVLRESEEFPEALKLSASILKELSGMIYEQVHVSRERRIENAVREQTALSTETGEEYDDLLAYIELAKESLAEEDYEMVDSSLEEFKMYRDQYQRTFDHSQYRDKIDLIRKDMDAISGIDMDISPIEELLEKSEKALNEDDLEEVGDAVEKAEVLYREILEGTLKKSAKDLISDTKERILPLKKAGVNVKFIERILKRARSSFMENDYLEAWLAGQDAKEKTVDLKEGLESKETAIGLLKDTRTQMNEISLPGLDTTPVESMIQEAKSGLKKRDYKNSMELATSARKKLADIINSAYIEKLDELSGKLDLEIERAVEQDLDVDKFMTALDEIKTLRESEDFPEAVKLSGSIHKELSEMIYEQVHLSRERRIENAVRELAVFSSEAGKEYDDLQLSIEGAKEGLAKEDYDRVDSSLEEFQLNKDEYQSVFVISHYRERIDHVRQDADTLREIDMDITSIEELLEKSEMALSEDDLDMVGDMVDKAEVLCCEIIEGPIKKSAKELMSDTRELILPMKKAGIKVRSIERTLKRARSTFREKDYTGAWQAAHLAKEKTLKLKEGLQTREATIDLLKDARTQMNEISLPGLDTSSVESMIQEAKSGLKKRDFKNSMELATSAREKLTDIINSAYVEKLDDTTEKLNTEIERAMELDLDVNKFMSTLDEVKEMRESEEFPEAIKLSGSIHKELSEMIYEAVHVSRERRIENAVRELASLSGDTGKEYDDLLARIEGAKEGLAKKDYDRVDSSLEEFQLYKDEYQSIFVLSNYRDKIDHIRQDANTIREIDIDISSIEELLEKSENALGEDDLDMVGEAVDKAEELCREIIVGPIKKLAKELIPDTRDMILPMKKAGVNVKSVEVTLKLARSAFRENDYLRSWQAAHKAKDEILGLKEGLKMMESANALLGEAEIQLSEIKLPDLDTSSVESMMQEAKSGLEKKDYITSLELAKSARETLSDITKTAYIKKLDDATQKLNTEIERAMEQDLDVKKFMSTYDEVKVLRESGEFQEAIDISESIHEELSRMIYEHVHLSRERRIEKTVEELTAFSNETGREYPDLFATITVAKEGLAEKDYDMVDTYLEEFQVTKDEHAKEHTRQKLDAKMEEIRKDVSFLEGLEIDVSKCRKLISLVSDAMEQEDLDEVSKRVITTERELETIKEDHFKPIAKDHISRATEMLESIEGRNLKAEGEMIKQALDSFAKRDYKNAWKFSLKAKETLDSVIEEIEAIKRLEEKRIRINSTLREVKLKMGIGQGIGLDMSPIQMMLENIPRTISDESIEDAESNTAKVKTRLEEIFNSKIPNILERRTEEFQKTLDGIADKDMDVKEEEELFHKVLELQEAGKHLEGIDLLREPQASLNNKLLIHTKANFATKIDQAKEELVNLESNVGEELNEPRSHLTGAKEALIEGDLETVDTYLKMLKRATEEIEIGYLTKKYNEDLTKMETEVRDLKDLGIDTRGIEELLKTGKGYVSQFDFSIAASTILETAALIEEMKSTRSEEPAKALQDNIRAMWDEMHKKGIDFKDQEKLIQEISSEIEREEFLKACYLALEAKKKLKNIEREHFKGLLSAARKEISDMLAEARQIEIDASEEVGDLESASSYFENGQYEESYEVTLKSKNTIQKKIETELMERIRSGFVYVDRVIENSKENDIDVEKEMQDLGHFLEFEKEGKYRLALQMLTDIKNSLNKKIRYELMAKNTKRVKDARRAMSLLQKETGDDYPGLRGLLENVEGQFAKKDFAVLTTALNEFNDAKRGYEEEVFKGKYTGQIREISKELGFIKDLGLDTTSVEEVVHLAKEKLEALDYESTRVEITRARNNLHNIKTVVARDEVKKEYASLIKLYNLLSKTERVSENEKAMMDDVENGMQKHDYMKCILLVKDLRTALMTTRDGYFREKAAMYLEQDREMLEGAKEVGLDTQALRDLIKKSESLLAEGESREAMVLAMESRNTFRDKIEAAFSVKYNEKLGSLIGVIEEARDRGVDINKANKLLTEAGRFKDASQYRVSITILDKVKAALDKKLRQQRRSIYEMRLKDLDRGTVRQAEPVEWVEETVKDEGDPVGSPHFQAKPVALGSSSNGRGIKVKNTGEMYEIVTSQKDGKQELGEDETSTDEVEDFEESSDGTTEEPTSRYGGQGGQYGKQADQHEEVVEVEEEEVEDVEDEVVEQEDDLDESEDSSGLPGRDRTEEEEVEEEEEEEEEDDGPLSDIITNEQLKQLNNATKKDIQAIKAMMEGNVFRMRIGGRRFNLFRRGIGREMEELVHEIRYNNSGLEPDEIIDEINGLLFK